MAEEWSYRVLTQKEMSNSAGDRPEERLQATLKTLGKEGWELVLVRQESPDPGVALWIFKKPQLSPEEKRSQALEKVDRLEAMLYEGLEQGQYKADWADAKLAELAEMRERARKPQPTT